MRNIVTGIRNAQGGKVMVNGGRNMCGGKW